MDPRDMNCHLTSSRPNLDDPLRRVDIEISNETSLAQGSCLGQLVGDHGWVATDFSFLSVSLDNCLKDLIFGHSPPPRTFHPLITIP
ncbi:hypothetical protein CROQUDRAFT_97570 [Cronartium quercuum f. sp. fusiforme G11]|uniref:Uncharacterized protein n=1 Tax=Cronartium quercuum f. sp. fusiforme G11 TaxID=708437 RepID=A0A9P6NAK7_9BASI|nr:hypothetical protein CROQUDRAFT_97570 [Cronartium quercuum f. sp. fusiforme G11]